MSEYIAIPREATEIGVFREQGYSRADTEEEVREAFKKKYGYEPNEIRSDGGGWYAGPIDES